MKHDERQLAMFKDKREGANASWDRVYERFKLRMATKEELVLAMQLCNDAEKAYMAINRKMAMESQKIKDKRSESDLRGKYGN